MVLLGVDIVTFEVGFGFLVSSGAVAGAYAIHVRLMNGHVRRVQRERSLALNVGRSTGEAEPATAAFGPARPVLILGLSSARSLRAAGGRLAAFGGAGRSRPRTWRTDG